MLKKFIGFAPEELSFADQRRLGGAWVAFELYTPRTVPLRKMQAIGPSFEDCVDQIRASGRSPQDFEFRLLSRPVAW